MKRLTCLAIAAAMTACSSSTSIVVSDPEARILVNGEYVGTGKAHYSDLKPAFTKQAVTLRKDGCADQEYVLRRNERPDFGAIFTAYWLYLPILWMTQYKPRHAYEFDCMPTAEATSNVSD